MQSAGVTRVTASSTGSSAYSVTDESLANDTAVWNNRNYVFGSVDGALSGALLIRGPHRIPSGEVLTFTCPQTVIYYVLVTSGRGGTYPTTLANAGWTLSGDAATWLDQTHHAFDIWFLVASPYSIVQLPPAVGSDTVVTFAFANRPRNLRHSPIWFSI